MSQDTEWLTWRRQGIGASDIAPILGLSPFSSAYSVWLDKTEQVPPDEGGTLAMRRGQHMESFILDEFQTESGLVVGHRGERFEDDWIRCTLDGGVDPDGAIEVVETKNTSHYPWDEPPIHYYLQCQWQMLNTGAKKAHLVAMHPRSLEVYVIDRDNEDIEAMLDAAERFWKRNVCGRVAPEPTGADLDAVRQRWPESVAKKVEVDEAVFSLVMQLEAAKDAASQQADTIADLTARLLAEFGEADTLTHKGRDIATWRSQNSFDVDEATRAHPDLAADLAVSKVPAGAFAKALGKKEADRFRHPSTRTLKLKGTA